MGRRGTGAKEGCGVSLMVSCCVIVKNDIGGDTNDFFQKLIEDKARFIVKVFITGHITRCV